MLSGTLIPRLFSYVVDRDYGFAPNPFHGVCTLATCKPGIRKGAAIGDWVVGTGSSKRGRKGFIVYVMRVTEAMTFNEYWSDQRFRRKKPTLRGSKKQAFGDNIYFRVNDNQWHQEDSHHSYENGTANPHNIRNDTQTDRILVGAEYAYWGGAGPEIAGDFRNYDGKDICAIRNYKNKFPTGLVDEFIAWFQSLDAHGYLGEPLDWPRTP